MNQNELIQKGYKKAQSDLRIILIDYGLYGSQYQPIYEWLSGAEDTEEETYKAEEESQKSDDCLYKSIQALIWQKKFEAEANNNNNNNTKENENAN